METKSAMADIKQNLQSEYAGDQTQRQKIRSLFYSKQQLTVAKKAGRTNKTLVLDEKVLCFIVGLVSEKHKKPRLSVHPVQYNSTSQSFKSISLDLLSKSLVVITEDETKINDKTNKSFLGPVNNFQITDLLMVLTAIQHSAMQAENKNMWDTNKCDIEYMWPPNQRDIRTIIHDFNIFQDDDIKKKSFLNPALEIARSFGLVHTRESMIQQQYYINLLKSHNVPYNCNDKQQEKI